MGVGSEKTYTAGIIRKCWGFEGIGVGCRFMAEILFFGMEMVGDVAMKTGGAVIAMLLHGN